MNTTNPFQIPPCFQTNREQRRRDRFKKAVIAGVVVAGLLLVSLLIEGCKTERLATAAPITVLGEVPAAPASMQTAASAPAAMPMSISQTAPAAVPKSSPVRVSNANATPAASPAAAVYVVKHGDTLTRIARAHGTTVKAMRVANGLAGDRIAVGARLKLPEA